MTMDMLFPDQNRHVRFLMGLYISKKRNEKGFSVGDVANLLDLAPQSYKKIETGRMKINSDIFDKMQNLLSLDLEELDEIRQIACVRYINDLSKALVSNYPV